MVFGAWVQRLPQWESFWICLVAATKLAKILWISRVAAVNYAHGAGLLEGWCPFLPLPLLKTTCESQSVALLLCSVLQHSSGTLAESHPAFPASPELPNLPSFGWLGRGLVSALSSPLRSGHFIVVQSIQRNLISLCLLERGYEEQLSWWLG